MKRSGSILKRFFTPTEQDEMLPLGLRAEAFFLYFLFAVVIILSPAYVRVSQLATLASPVIGFDAAKVVALVNASRAAIGFPKLAENPKLDTAAEFKVNDMFEYQYFAHFSPTNKSPWSFFKAADYLYYAAGENLAIDFVSADEAHAALMNSPTHRANILSPLYAEIGVSVRQGIFSGRSSIIVAQYFGKERVTAPAPSMSSGRASSAVAPSAVSLPAMSLSNGSKSSQAASSPVLPPPTTSVLGTAANEVKPQPRPEPATEKNPPAIVAPEATFLKTEEAAVTLAQEALARPGAIRMFLTSEIEIKLVVLVAVLTILLSFTFLITRSGAVSVPVVTRTLVLLVLFGYIAVVGIGTMSVSKITPSSPSIVAVLENQ